MKILIINTNDTFGGAAIAAFRLHEALLQNGVDSQMLVADKKSDINSVLTLQNKNLGEKLGKTIILFLEKLPLRKYKNTISKNFGPFSSQVVSNKKLVKTINEINPDIVHLHWICGGFLSIEDIAKIKSPIVWSLHDQWGFTGGCHCVCDDVSKNSGLCEKYTKNCGNCGFLGSKRTKDLSFDVLQRKKKSFSKVNNMTIIGLSKWLQNCAKSSSVFSNKPVVNLPNTINTNVFKPINKEIARNLWNLPAYKKLILFGAVSATSTPYKGFAELTEALGKISVKNIEFVVFGSSEPKNPPNFPCKVHYLGHLNDNASLISIYNACDVMAHPSKRENLSNVIMEALSCGLPVVAFDIGGNSDMIEHKKNGYLAQQFDTSDFAKGIDWVLNNEKYDELSKNARKKIVDEFDYNVVANKYIQLYDKVLKR